jgi:hypothetical protein
MQTVLSSPLMGEEKGEGVISLPLTPSRQGRENKKMRLPRPDKSGLAMTPEVTAPVKNTGKTRYNSQS